MPSLCVGSDNFRMMFMTSFTMVFGCFTIVTCIYHVFLCVKNKQTSKQVLVDIKL